MSIETPLFLCRYRGSNGAECGTPITLHPESLSGFIHAEGHNWLHWASPVAYGPQGSEAAFVKRAGARNLAGGSVTNPISKGGEGMAKQFLKYMGLAGLLLAYLGVFFVLQMHVMYGFADGKPYSWAYLCGWCLWIMLGLATGWTAIRAGR